MTFAGLLADVIGRMDSAGLPHMVTGSLASGILRVAVDLDEAYIDLWAAALGLGQAWRALQDEARSR